MPRFIHKKGGYVHKMHKTQGSGIKPIVQKRHEEHHDPNLEILKNSLHELNIKGNVRLKGKAQGDGVAKLKKSSKYIVF